MAARCLESGDFYDSLYANRGRYRRGRRLVRLRDHYSEREGKTSDGGGSQGSDLPD
jgi:hypothetical protein